jgi:RNA polymerase sigma-70 factor (ECF subfamily)
MVRGKMTGADNQLLAAARSGNQDALHHLFAAIQPVLFRFLYRMVANREDAQDLLQDCWIRAQRGIHDFRGEAASMEGWWFAIASNLALDHLRARKRWRVDAQLIGERELDSQPEELENLAAIMSDPEFRYEVTEHIAFCFSCIGRTLEPMEEAALLLREVFEFTNVEAALVLGLSEPTFRHKLSAARTRMKESYDGLCQLINKTGRCYQCVNLREFAPERSRGALITEIKPAAKRGISSPADALLEARFDIVRESNLENGGMAKLHTAFFQSITAREEESADLSAKTLKA